jgi:hypothetical protein
MLTLREHAHSAITEDMITRREHGTRLAAMAETMIGDERPASCLLKKGDRHLATRVFLG